METREVHPIRVVAQRTGLSLHLIRMWERRYHAVQPTRNPTNRRLYSDADIDRLQWLRRATQCGRSIGQVAALPTDRLAAIVRTDEASSPRPRGPSTTLVEDCQRAVQSLDPEALEDLLRRARVELSFRNVLDNVVAPLVDRIGSLWRDEIIRPVHEHVASAVIRTFLGTLEHAFPTPAGAPRLVVATPRGQLHEMGALLVAATAGSEGWRVTYLGPSLAADEIAQAAATRQARAVALSIVFPCDDTSLADELAELRRQIGETMPLLCGGRGAESYREALERAGALLMSDLGALRDFLGGTRDAAGLNVAGAPPAPGS